MPDHVTVSGLRNALVLIPKLRIESDQPIFAGEHQAFTSSCTSVFNDFPHECTGATAMLILRRSIHAENHLPVTLRVVLRGILVHVIGQVAPIGRETVDERHDDLAINQ